jgi:hypothetical protein
MPFVDENEVKKESAYLKYFTGDAGNILILKSNLYRIPIHWIQTRKRGVACMKEDCIFCKNGYPKRTEFNYLVALKNSENESTFPEGQVGAMDIKSSVFFAVQQLAKQKKKEPRQITWLVIKTGTGTDTVYTVSKEDNLTDEEFAKLQEELATNNEKLQKLMVAHERQLEGNYGEFGGDAVPQAPAKLANKVEDQEEIPQPKEEPEGVEENDMPF